MQTEIIKDQIRTFIVEHFPLARKRNIGNTDNLLTSGLLDSLGVLDLVTFLEQEFAVSVSDEDLVPEVFQSIERLGVFVQNKCNGTDPQ